MTDSNPAGKTIFGRLRSKLDRFGCPATNTFQINSLPLSADKASIIVEVLDVHSDALDFHLQVGEHGIDTRHLP